jgi:hypothetical protein
METKVLSIKKICIVTLDMAQLIRDIPKYSEAELEAFVQSILTKAKELGNLECLDQLDIDPKSGLGTVFFVFSESLPAYTFMLELVEATESLGALGNINFTVRPWLTKDTKSVKKKLKNLA